MTDLLLGALRLDVRTISTYLFIYLFIYIFNALVQTGLSIDTVRENPFTN